MNKIKSEDTPCCLGCIPSNPNKKIRCIDCDCHVLGVISSSKVPEIFQAFDFYEDRVYYKIIQGILFSSDRIIRRDRLKKWCVWQIECSQMPDDIKINGEFYELKKLDSL